MAVDSTGIPWAYHNVCPHRAGPILFPGRGQTDRLKCQYHGWCFSYEGALIDSPDFGTSVDFNPADQRLREISMGNWGGFLWVALAGDVQPLRHALGHMVEACNDIPFDDLVHTEHTSRMMNCNWKVFVDNLLESYPVPGSEDPLIHRYDDDQRVCEMAQKNLEAGIFRRGHLSPNHGSSLVWFKNKILIAHDHRTD